MVQRSRIFLVVWLLIFSMKNFGQNIPQQIYFGINSQEILTRFKIKQSIYETIKNKPSFILIANRCVAENNIVNNSQITLYPGYLKGILVMTQGVLCRVEYKFQTVTTIPLRLRLGSLEYTNYLEQKPNALKPN